jgi:hypothetical protein
LNGAEQAERKKIESDGKGQGKNDAASNKNDKGVNANMPQGGKCFGVIAAICYRFNQG